ncbi:MAG: GNAT family N-acetyltransferase [Oscillospiraceae bacterium]
MDIIRLKQKEYSAAIDLAWRVFTEFEAANYSESGKKAFWEAIHDKAYLSSTAADRITVHSSIYAEKIYKRLGFSAADGRKDEGGIIYIPMVFES